jgi:hypothetical protein
MTDVPFPALIADSPMGERLTWLLNHVRAGGREWTDAEIEANFATEDVSINGLRTRLTSSRGLLPGFELRSVRSHNPEQVAIAVLEGDGHTWEVGVRIEPRPPHRMRTFVRAERMPGVEIRVATDSDANVLREIELRTPLKLGETQVVYDRGEDYFAAERLMGNVITHIVELHGRAVGLTSWVMHGICAKGERMLASYKHRTRLLPEARGQGMRQMLDFAGFEASSGQADVMYTLASAANETVRHIYGEGNWSVRPERLVIDTKLHAGPHAGRPSTPADGERIVDLLNRAHGREELYAPYTTDSLAVRFGREPNLYSWGNLRLGERAVVGAWPAHLGVIRTADGESTTDNRALVLDYGYEEGAEDEFIALIKAECATLSQSDTTELATFASPQSTAYPQLSTLAKRTEPYILYFAVPPPADLASRGVYIDQLYF